MRDAAVTLKDGIGLGLHYECVQHKLWSKRAALGVIQHEIQKTEKERGLLADKDRQLVCKMYAPSRQACLKLACRTLPTSEHPHTDLNMRELNHNNAALVVPHVISYRTMPA